MYYKFVSINLKFFMVIKTLLRKGLTLLYKKKILNCTTIKKFKYLIYNNFNF